jgi:hypothetical protein
MLSLRPGRTTGDPGPLSLTVRDLDGRSVSDRPTWVRREFGDG